MSALFPNHPAENPSSEPLQALSSDEVIALLYELRGAAISCLAVMVIVAEPLQSSDLIELCGYGRTTIKAGLRKLREAQLARYDRKFQAWSLTAQGRNLIRSIVMPAEKKFPKTAAGVKHPDRSGRKVTHRGRRLSESDPLSLKEVKEVIEGEMYLKESKDLTSSSRLSYGQAAGLRPQADRKDVPGSELVARILENSELLFGERLVGSPERFREPKRLLAIVAETYQNRERLRKPARVAYSAYHQGRNPDRAFWDYPERYLPAEFLSQIGLPEPDRGRGWQDQDWIDPLEQARQAGSQASSWDQPLSSGSHLPTREPPSNCAPGLDPIQAGRWRDALRLMQLDLDHVVFRRYLADLVLVSYDPQEGQLTIGCRDAALQAWLEDRMRRKLERMLTGIWARVLTVVFVVWPPQVEA